MKSLLTRFSVLNRDLKLLWFAIFCLSLGSGIFNACNYNFMTEILKIRPGQLGIVESIRETPGFLCVLVVALLMSIAEPLLASLGILIMGMGTAAYASVYGIPSLIVWSWVASLGFHVWQALQSSLVLGLAEAGKQGKRMGQTMCVASIGAICGALLVHCFSYGLSFSNWFLLSGACMVTGAIPLVCIRRNIGHPDKPKFVWKAKYRLYYILTLLEGGRKQVFITFAIYALTREFGVRLGTVAILMFINQAINIIGGPIVGRMIDRIGERRIMIFCYTALVFVFMGYALAKPAAQVFDSKLVGIWMMYVLFTLDNLLYLSATCLSTYLQKITDPEDLMPTLSMGVSFNHTASVIVPLIGGLLWARFGYGAAFYGGAVLVGVSALLAKRVPMHKPQAIQEAT